MRSASVSMTAALSAAFFMALSMPAAQAARHRHGHVPSYVTAAVADAGRPESDRKRDTERKPTVTLAFSGVKPGDKVAELIPAAGYYTRMLSKIVGSSGHVYMLVPPSPKNRRPGMRDMMTMANAIAQNPEYSNVSVVSLAQPGSGFGLPEPVDLLWTTDNYHDFHNFPNADMAAFNKRVFDALKPGGIYFIEDHAAAPGTGTSVTRTLHRIDPAQVRKEVEAAGFEYVGENNALRNPHDPHTKIIFDPSIRGHTDRFILKFRKPS
ncbi:MAG: class I SAM-dependent methyltransferase [Steroidobacteraceae bacterium]